MKKFCALMFLVLVMIASSANAEYPMPYCPCIGLEYAPVGPEYPAAYHGETLSGIFNSKPGIIEELWIDIGDLPYSVPDYGWHRKPVNFIVHTPFRADIYATDLGMDIQFRDMACCDAVVNPDTPLFHGGVFLIWDDASRTYTMNAAGDTYVAEVVVLDGQAQLSLYVYSVNPITGHRTVYVKYLVFFPVSAGPVAEDVQHMRVK